MKRGLLLAVLVAVLTACASVPTGLKAPEENGPLKRRVARLARKSGAHLGLVALHVESGRELSWNDTETFEGASVIKLALLAEAAARIQEERLEPSERWRLSDRNKAAPSSTLSDLFDPGLEPTHRDLLRVMIAISDNTATNAYIDMFGAEAVNDRMTSLGLPDIKLLGRIPDRDPPETVAERWRGLALSSMTPRATATFLKRLVTGSRGGEPLVDVRTDRYIWDILRLQRSLERLPRVALYRKGTSWAGKTGTMRGVRADAGILTTPKGHFVLVCFADHVPEPMKANLAMGEIADAVLDAWWDSLPDLAEEPLVPLPPAHRPPAIERIEIGPQEARRDIPEVPRVYRGEDERFWTLYGAAGGDVARACLIPSPNSWWEGNLFFKIEPLSSIVLHHTAMEDDESCIDLFQKTDSGVSSHFLVGLDGRLYQFVSLEHRAWHAGLSLLHGRRALNRTSVGIEITGDGNLHPFTPAQIETVTRLVGVLVAMYDVPAPWIAGHQHVAPDRKPDPGAFFPWNEVVRNSLDLARRLGRNP